MAHNRSRIQHICSCGTGVLAKNCQTQNFKVRTASLTPTHKNTHTHTPQRFCRLLSLGTRPAASTAADTRPTTAAGARVLGRRSTLHRPARTQHPSLGSQWSLRGEVPSISGKRERERAMEDSRLLICLLSPSAGDL